MLATWHKFRTFCSTRMVSPYFAKHGKACRIGPRLRFSGLDHVTLGDSVNIHSDCWILTVNNLADAQPVKLEIGSHCEIGMNATISAAHRIVLHDSVLLARNVYISDHNHAYDRINVPITDQDIADVAPVEIGRGTWLGQNAVVLPGVTIGQNCVIGANSVVNRSIPDFSVAVGTPARVVKRFNPATQTWERATG